MKIAILTYQFLPILGGGEIFHNKLALHLSKTGNNVLVISNYRSVGYNSSSYPLYKTPRPFKIASRLAHLFVASLYLFFVHIFRTVDVIHVAGLTDLFAVFPAKFIFRTPVVLRLSMWSHPYILNKLRRIATLFADIIIVFDDNMKTKLVEGGYFENKIVTIPNGVDLKKFRPKSIVKNKDKITLLWVGRLESGKAPHLAVKTLALIKNFHKNVCLHIIGEGKMENQLQKLVEFYNLNDSIIFLGRQNHNKIAEKMINADIFLMTSKGEGMSNALLEAMASGMAVVATSASASDVIENGINGFVADDPNEMSSIISKLINDPSLRYKAGINARRTAMEKYSDNRMFLNYVQIYNKLLRK